MDLLSFYYSFDLFPNIAINVIFRLIQREGGEIFVPVHKSVQ